MEVSAWNNLTNGSVSKAALFDIDGKSIQERDPEDRTDGLDLPHVITFASMYRGAAYTYNHMWDEAMKHSRTNALAMRRDAWLMSLLRERADETLSKPWHLEVDNPRDKWQKTVCQGMTKIVRSIHRLKRLQRYLLQGSLWYGRYGANVKWAWKTMYLPLMQSKGSDTSQPSSSPAMAKGKVLTIVKHKPVNGDKIGHHDDDTPYVLINSSFADRIAGERQVIYPNNAQGPALLLRGTWRDQIIIHTSDPDDGDYFDAEMAEAVHGVGIRSRIYWLDFLRRDYFGAVTEMLNRIGLGLVVIYYDSSNNSAREEAEKMAKNFSRRSVIVMPRTNDGVSQGGGIEVVETPMAGAQIMLELQKHVEEQIERYMIGQLISAGGGTSNPLEGTGRAEFAKDTKTQTCLADAMDHDETWTGSDEEPGPVSIIKKWTYSYADFPVRYVTEQEKPNAADTLEAAKVCVDMGIELPVDPIRELTGIRAPEEGEETVGGKEEMMALAEMEAEASGMGDGQGGEREGAGRDEDPEGVKEVAPAEEYAAEPKRGNPGTQGGPKNAGQFGPGSVGKNAEGGGRLSKRRQLMAKAASQGGDTGVGAGVDLGKSGQGKPGEEEQGMDAMTPDAGAMTPEEMTFVDPTVPSTVNDKSSEQESENEEESPYATMTPEQMLADYEGADAKEWLDLKSEFNVIGRKDMVKICGEQAKAALDAELQAEIEEQESEEESNRLPDTPEKLLADYEGASGDEWMKVKIEYEKAGGRMDLVMFCTEKAMEAYEKESEEYTSYEPVVPYSEGELSIRQLLDRIRRIGPVKARELIDGLISTLKRNPKLARGLSSEDLALVQSLSMSDPSEHATIFEVMT